MAGWAAAGNGNIANAPENVEQLLEQFLNAGPIQVASPEVLARYLARRTRELQTQIAATLTDENSEIYRMFSAFKELLIATLTPTDFADMYAQTLAYGLFAARCILPNATNFSRHTACSDASKIKSVPSSNSSTTSTPRPLKRTSPTFWTTSKRFSEMSPQRCYAQRLLQETILRIGYPLLRNLPRRIRSTAPRRSRCLLYTATGYLLHRQVGG